MGQPLHRLEASLHQILVEATERRCFNGGLGGNREKTNNWPALNLGTSQMDGEGVARLTEC